MQHQPALAPSPHMLRSSQDNTSSNAEQALREQLLGHSNPDSQLQTQLQAQQRTHAGANEHSSPATQQLIDPAIAGSGMMSHSPGESGGEDGNDPRKGGKRELSTSKRAAQNRAAQRAFRQRKEGHIKKLEEQVRDYTVLNESFKRMQAENYQLRDYIISLQSRLIESQGDYPQPPVNIDLQQPRPDLGQGGAPTANMGATAASQLQASALQAVAEGRGVHGMPVNDRTDPALTGRQGGAS